MAFIGAFSIPDFRNGDWRSFLSIRWRYEQVCFFAAALLGGVGYGKSGFRPELSNCEGLVVTRRGSTANGGGTWLHPKLAVAFARWLSPDFAVWCDLHIDALLHGELNERQQFERACKALDDARHVASLSGKELAAWRWKKPGLECQVEHWREQLQLTLGLDAA